MSLYDGLLLVGLVIIGAFTALLDGYLRRRRVAARIRAVPGALALAIGATAAFVRLADGPWWLPLLPAVPWAAVVLLPHRFFRFESPSGGSTR